MTHAEIQDKQDLAPIESEIWLSSTQVAEASGYSISSILDWVKSGVIPAGMFERSPGGRHRFRPEVVEHIRTYHQQQQKKAVS